MTTQTPIMMQSCRKCGMVDALTRTICSNCLGDVFDAIEVASTGTLVSWTTIRRAPTRFRDEVPYDVCVVDLINGQRVTGRLAHSDASRVGTAVAAIAIREGTPYFSSV